MTQVQKYTRFGQDILSGAYLLNEDQQRICPYSNSVLFRQKRIRIQQKKKNNTIEYIRATTLGVGSGFLVKYKGMQLISTAIHNLFQG